MAAPTIKNNGYEYDYESKYDYKYDHGRDCGYDYGYAVTTTSTTTSTRTSTSTRMTVTTNTNTTTSTNTTTTTTTPTSTTRRRVRRLVRVRLSKTWHCLTHGSAALVIKPYNCDNCAFRRAPARLDMAIISENPAKPCVRFGPELAAGKWALPRLYLHGGALNWCPFSGPRNLARAEPLFLPGAARCFAAGGMANNYVEGKLY